MPDPCQLAPDVVQDLEAVFDYTIDRWGIEQAHRYKSKIVQHLNSIAQGKARLKTFLETRPELQVSRCEHHYVFHLVRENQAPLIIAILHERMNMIDRIRNRLDP